jgi:CBS domain containing-hemolysin-like protein
VLSGLLRPEEVRDLTGLAVPASDVYQTLGGLVTAALGHIPTAGDSVPVDGMRLTVTRMDGRRVDRVRLTAGYERPAEGEDESSRSAVDGAG